MTLLAPLNPDQRATFLAITLRPAALKRLVGALGTAPPGTRIDGLSVWDLAWSLVDHYEHDAEVSRDVDRALRKALGTIPLAAALRDEGTAEAVEHLVLASPDPLRDLAWALLTSGDEAARARAAGIVERILEEFDAAEEEAKRREQEEAEAQPETAPASDDERARELAREASRLRRAHQRAAQRVDDFKQRTSELERTVAGLRQELRAAQEQAASALRERDRLAEERDGLRAQLRTGTPAEVARLREELETASRRVRALESDLEEARSAEEALSARVAELERRPAAPDTPARPEPEERPTHAAGWSLPILTREFYDSLARWDRRIVRTAFERIARLAEDWRHPSLRAIPLEGLPDYFRLRVATDVRLIYRPAEGNTVEILSLIDREDLQRYIRQAKNRR